MAVLVSKEEKDTPGEDRKESSKVGSGKKEVVRIVYRIVHGKKRLSLSTRAKVVKKWEMGRVKGCPSSVCRNWILTRR
jgi:hypothetical protein